MPRNDSVFDGCHHSFLLFTLNFETMKITPLFLVLCCLQCTVVRTQTLEHTPTDFYNQVIAPYNAVSQSSVRLLSVMVHHSDNNALVETEVSTLKTAILSAKTQYEALSTQSPSEQKLKAEAIAITLNLPVQLGLVDIAKPCDETMSYYKRLYQSLLQQETYDKNMKTMSNNFLGALGGFVKENRIELLSQSKSVEQDSVAKALNLIHKLRKTLCEVMIPMEDFFKAAEQTNVKNAGEAIGKLKKVLADKNGEMGLIKAQVTEPDTPFEPFVLFISHVNTFSGVKKMGAIMQYLQATEGISPELSKNYNGAIDFYNKSVFEAINQFEASSAAFQKRKIPDVLAIKN